LEGWRSRWLLSSTHRRQVRGYYLPAGNIITTKGDTMENAIKIEGDTYAPETLKAITDSIVRILDSKAEQKTIRQALLTFTEMAQRHLTIHGCNINGGGTHTHYHSEPEAAAEDDDFSVTVASEDEPS
jgi:hypothetical protein